MTGPEPVTLTGAFVRLEPLSRDHVNGIMRAGADERIWRWLPWHLQTREDFANWVEGVLSAQARGQQQPFATVDAVTSDVVGSTSLFLVSPRDKRVEIGGTWLSPKAQRTAANTESKLLLLMHCFETLGCVRVELKTDARNEPSRAAILRIGAQFEGVMRKHMLTQGGLHRDSAYYGITDDDWPGVKTRLETMLAR
jgi:RimJ/RimL family protein N-acetyltransferase